MCNFLHLEKNRNPAYTATNKGEESLEPVSVSELMVRLS
jgi:hypothetical protein